MIVHMQQEAWLMKTLSALAICLYSVLLGNTSHSSDFQHTEVTIQTFPHVTNNPWKLSVLRNYHLSHTVVRVMNALVALCGIACISSLFNCHKCCSLAVTGVWLQSPVTWLHSPVVCRQRWPLCWCHGMWWILCPLLLTPGQVCLLSQWWMADIGADGGSWISLKALDVCWEGYTSELSPRLPVLHTHTYKKHNHKF